MTGGYSSWWLMVAKQDVEGMGASYWTIRLLNRTISCAQLGTLDVQKNGWFLFVSECNKDLDSAKSDQFQEISTKIQKLIPTIPSSRISRKPIPNMRNFFGWPRSRAHPRRSRWDYSFASPPNCSSCHWPRWLSLVPRRQLFSHWANWKVQLRCKRGAAGTKRGWRNLAGFCRVPSGKLT